MTRLRPVSRSERTGLGDDLARLMLGGASAAIGFLVVEVGRHTGFAIAFSAFLILWTLLLFSYWAATGR